MVERNLSSKRGTRNWTKWTRQKSMETAKYGVERQPMDIIKSSGTFIFVWFTSIIFFIAVEIRGPRHGAIGDGR